MLRAVCAIAVRRADSRAGRLLCGVAPDGFGVRPREKCVLRFDFRRFFVSL